MVNSNTITEVIPQLLAQGLEALREDAVTPRLVNRAYELLAGEKGSTVDVSIPSAITAGAVTAANTAPDDTGFTPTSVALALDQWYEAPFFMTDNDMLQSMNGTIPMQASEAVKALVNNVDDAVLAHVVSFWGTGGVAGTTPFATDASEYLVARGQMNNNLAPKGPRYTVLNTDAEANALGIRAFQDTAWNQNSSGITEGQIGRKLGSTWFVNQNVPTHTESQAGTALVDSGAGYAVGVNLIHMDGFTTKPEAGDRFTLAPAAGDTQVYVVTGSTALIGTDSDVSFQPALKVALAAGDDSTAVTFAGDYVANSTFQRDAIALATRPFAAADPLGLGFFQSNVDEVSGLALRLELSRQHRRTRYAFDILYGTQLIRGQFGSIIYG